MDYIATHKCPNCGNILYMRPNGQVNIFCNHKCQIEYGEKKRMAKKQKQLETAAMRKAPIPERQCGQCMYGFEFGSQMGCIYFEITGHTRHSLHPGGMPKECQEFKRRRKGRTRKRWGD